MLNVPPSPKTISISEKNHIFTILFPFCLSGRVTRRAATKRRLARRSCCERRRECPLAAWTSTRWTAGTVVWTSGRAIYRRSTPRPDSPLMTRLQAARPPPGSASCGTSASSRSTETTTRMCGRRRFRKRRRVVLGAGRTGP